MANSAGIILTKNGGLVMVEISAINKSYSFLLAKSAV